MRSSLPEGKAPRAAQGGAGEEGERLGTGKIMQSSNEGWHIAER